MWIVWNLANMSSNSWNLLLSFGGCFRVFRVFWGMSRGGDIWHDSTRLTDCYRYMCIVWNLVNMSSNSWNLLLSFWGCFRSVSWFLGCQGGVKGDDIWHDSTMLADCHRYMWIVWNLANMSSNSWNLLLSFRGVFWVFQGCFGECQRGHDIWHDSAMLTDCHRYMCIVWNLANMSSNSWNLLLSFRGVSGMFWGVKGVNIWHDSTMLTDCHRYMCIVWNLANMRSNSWNLLLSFRGYFRGVLGCFRVVLGSIKGGDIWHDSTMLTDCHRYMCIVCSNFANMSSNSWNLLLSFRGCFRGVSGCLGVFQGCFVGVKGVTSDMTLQC